MTIAGVGPITDLLQAAATSVGSGVLLTGFATGVLGVVSRWPRETLDELVLRTGYIGGVVAVLALGIDLTLRYGWLA